MPLEIQTEIFISYLTVTFFITFGLTQYEISF